MSSSKKQRNLPSWMSSRGDDADPKEHRSSSSSSVAHPHFSKLMEGVVFVLSGFVNPERAELRSRTLEMGAQFQPDWNPNCTLLICAFPNTPKFRQVEADSGTIVSRDWISECYSQRKLVEIEPYLLHAGKPWRRSSLGVSPEPNKDHKAPSALKTQKQVEKSSNSWPSSVVSPEGKPSNQVHDSFSPSRVKKWATDDLGKTVMWLESQDEKPEQSEMKIIAAQGILTCLQDTIDSLEQGKQIQQISEQWACIPRVVEELIKHDSTKSEMASVGKEDVCRQAVACKEIYEAEYKNIGGDGSSSSSTKSEKKKRGGKGRNEKEGIADGEGAYDSDETVVMTEEEIEQAYNTVASSLACS